MTRLGMDADAVEASAKKMQILASQITTIRHQADAAVALAKQGWFGEVVEMFVSDWNGTHLPRLLSAQQALEDYVQKLQRNVQDQRDTSDTPEPSAPSASERRFHTGPLRGPGEFDYLLKGEKDLWGATGSALGLAGVSLRVGAHLGWNSTHGGPNIISSFVHTEEQLARAADHVAANTAGWYKESSRAAGRLVNWADSVAEPLSLEIPRSVSHGLPILKGLKIGMFGAVAVGVDGDAAWRAAQRGDVSGAVVAGISTALDVGGMVPGPIGLVCAGGSLAITGTEELFGWKP